MNDDHGHAARYFSSPWSSKNNPVILAFVLLFARKPNISYQLNVFEDYETREYV